jgi:hypothetical protein
MIRAWLAIAAIGGFVSVAAGALAAHLAGSEAHAADLLRVGASYGTGACRRPRRDRGDGRS